MSLPKKLEKMKIEEQEAFLIKKLQEMYELEKIYRRALAKVRGKVKIDVSEFDRPDLLQLKED
jgi:hypothetical protein